MNSASRPTSPINWIPASVARHPALLAAACLCVGVFLGDAIDTSPRMVLAVSLGVALIGWLLSQSVTLSRRLIGTLAIYLALVSLGAWRISVTNAGRPSASLTELMASENRVNIFARIDGVPFQKSSGWRVPLELIAVKGQSGDLPVDGQVLLTSIPTLQGLRFGDYIRFDGRVFVPSVRRNPGGFDYAEYLHRQGYDATVRPESRLTSWPQEKHWSLYNIADPVRQWIRESFSQNLDSDPQALLVGLLLGDTDRLPKPVYDAFRESGTSHLLAVSGANVWLIVGMILLPMYALSVPRWPRTIVALVVIVFFSFLTRNEPSVVRASLMVALILAGQLLWRPAAPLNAVGAAALIILLVSPAQVFRPGFQLSFAAVIGILVAVARVEPLLLGFWRKRLAYTITLFLVASIAATVATAPVSAWHFGTVPVAGLLSNLIMVPLAGLTAHLGLLLLPVQAISSTVTTGLSWAIGHLLLFSTNVARFFADFSWATLSWPTPSVIVLGHFVVGVILLLNWRHRFHWFRPLVYYACIVMVVVAVLRVSVPSRPMSSISLLDTGHQRVAVLTSDTGPTVGVIDDPGLDDELDQWVLQPFLRQKIGTPALEIWTPWRRLSEIQQTKIHPDHPAWPWRRFYSDEDTDSLGRPRVWADLWQTDSSDLLMYRDVPKPPVERILTALEEPLRSPTLIIPAQARVEWVREVVDRQNPTRVILYGRSRFGSSPDEALAFWRLRYPEVEFYSSSTHGAITLDILPSLIAITTTVSSPLYSGE